MLPSSSRALLITCRSGRPALVVACCGGRRRLPAPVLPATGAPPHGDVSVYGNRLLTSFPCPAVSGKKRLNLKKYLLLVDNGTSTVCKNQLIVCDFVWWSSSVSDIDDLDDEIDIDAW
jgi:hypothetical protein